MCNRIGKYEQNCRTLAKEFTLLFELHLPARNKHGHAVATSFLYQIAVNRWNQIFKQCDIDILKLQSILNLQFDAIKCLYLHWSTAYLFLKYYIKSDIDYILSALFLSVWSSMSITGWNFYKLFGMFVCAVSNIIHKWTFSICRQ